MVKIGESKQMPLGLGTIEIIAKSAFVLHINIGPGPYSNMVPKVNQDYVPAEARALSEELKKTYTSPQLQAMATFSGSQVFLESGLNAVKEIEEWLQQVGQS